MRIKVDIPLIRSLLSLLTKGLFNVLHTVFYPITYTIYIDLNALELQLTLLTKLLA